MSYPITLYNEDSRMEMHFVGPDVAVCWNCKIVEERKGRTTTVTYVRNKAWQSENEAPPYILFANTYAGIADEFDAEQDVRLEEDSPVEGGMHVGFAQSILEQLTLAIQYIENLPK